VPDMNVDERIPCRVWLAPDARTHCEHLLREALGGAEIVPVLENETPTCGPATLVMHVDDLNGPHRDKLKQLADLALPGRPIVLGNGSSKEILLDAINVWQAVQYVTPDTLTLTLADSVREAHRALRIELDVCDKIEQLSEECHHLNCVSEELRVTHKRVIHTERLATLGKIVGTVLDRMRQQVDCLENLKQAKCEVPADGPLADIFEAAVAGVDSFGALLEDLLALTEHREAKNTRAVMCLDDLARRAMRLFKHDSLARRRELEIECSSDAKVRVDPYRTIHVILNLLRNAAQATETSGLVALRTRIDGDFGVVEVQDDGCGMSQDTLARLFTPFFTTKGKDGMGLGLRLAKATVETHGGTIQCISTQGEGTQFQIRLPLVDGPDTNGTA
jgi:signal transduction histidine kinase